MIETHPLACTINGQSVSAAVSARLLFSDFLRQELGLTGTHVGCEHGVCGACTVLVDGHAVRSCLLLAVQVNGHVVRTVEGLAGVDGELTPLQRGFRDGGGLQCGFCTPGILMSLTALLDEEATPSPGRIEEVIGGHLCRCTGYRSILESVRIALADAADAGCPDGV